MGEGGQFFIGNFIEAPDVTTILFAQLRQPHIGAFGDQHGAWHPGGVRAESFIFLSRIAEDWDIGLSDSGRPLLFATLATTACCFLGGGARTACVGVELHPYRLFFFPENFAGNHQEAIHAVAQQRSPKTTDEGELFAERFRRAGRRSAKKIEQIHLSGAFHGHQRPGSEVLGQFFRDLAVHGLFGERFFFEEFFERLECLVAICGPQEEQFFESHGSMGHAFGCAAQPLPGRLLAAHHPLAGKMFDEGHKELVELSRTYLRSKPAQTSRHHLGIELLTILRQDQVADLVNQAHREKRTRMDGSIGVLCGVAHLIHAVSKGTARSQVGKDNIAVKGEKRLGKLITCSCRSRNVKFHHLNPALQTFDAKCKA
jgi:hypothetical protein